MEELAQAVSRSPPRAHHSQVGRRFLEIENLWLHSGHRAPWSCGRAESVDRRRVGKPRMEGHAPAVAGIPRTRTSVRLSARSMHVSSPPLDECVRACIRVRPKVHHEHTPHTHAHYASAGVHVLKLAGASCLHCPATCSQNASFSQKPSFRCWCELVFETRGPHETWGPGGG